MPGLRGERAPSPSSPFSPLNPRRGDATPVTSPGLPPRPRREPNSPTSPLDRVTMEWQPPSSPTALFAPGGGSSGKGGGGGGGSGSSSSSSSGQSGGTPSRSQAFQSSLTSVQTRCRAACALTNLGELPREQLEELVRSITQAGGSPLLPRPTAVNCASPRSNAVQKVGAVVKVRVGDKSPDTSPLLGQPPRPHARAHARPRPPSPLNGKTRSVLPRSPHQSPRTPHSPRSPTVFGPDRLGEDSPPPSPRSPLLGLERYFAGGTLAGGSGGMGAQASPTHHALAFYLGSAGVVLLLRPSMVFAGGLAPFWKSRAHDAATVHSMLSGSLLTTLAIAAVQYGGDARVCEGEASGRESVGALVAKLLMLAMVMLIFPLWVAILQDDRSPMMWEVQLLLHLMFTALSVYGHLKASAASEKHGRRRL
jgi:hypothetical protein